MTMCLPEAWINCHTASAQRTERLMARAEITAVFTCIIACFALRHSIVIALLYSRIFDCSWYTCFILLLLHLHFHPVFLYFWAGAVNNAGIMKLRMPMDFEEDFNHVAYPKYDSGNCKERHYHAEFLRPSSTIPWTSARCTRLLRPISSKIALLRKERLQTPHLNVSRANGAHLNSNCSHQNLGYEVPHDGLKKDTVASTQGEEWESCPRPRKKVKRTYSSRTRSFQQKGYGETEGEAPRFCPASGHAIVLPSPRSLCLGPSRSPQADSTTTSRPSSLPLLSVRKSQQPQELPRSLATGQWRLLDGICKGMVALLKATYTSELSPTSGSRSLLSTCLRQTPKYIAMEEALSDTEDLDDDTDATTNVYYDLEEYGSLAGGGWEPLRTLVRAHGMKMIRDAVEEGLLEPLVARHMISLCLDVAAIGEALQIIESLTNIASRTKTSSIRCDLRVISSGLDMLDSKFERRGDFYRQTTTLLAHGVMDMDWIFGRNMIATWNGVIRAIASADEHSQAASLLLRKATALTFEPSEARNQEEVHKLRLHAHRARKISMLRSAKAPNLGSKPTYMLINTDSNYSKEPYPQTLWNVITAVSAIACLQQPLPFTTASDYQSSIEELILDLAIDARLCIAIRGVGEAPCGHLGSYLESLCLPLLAGTITEILTIDQHEHHIHGHFESLSTLASLSTSSDAIRSAGSFVCAVARFCGLIRPDFVFDTMQRLVRNFILLSKSTVCNSSTQKFCGDVALAAAFTYSEDTNQPSHCDWSMQVESSLHGKGSDPLASVSSPFRTPARGNVQYQGTYRWEEGICEWIAKTPNVAIQWPQHQQNPTTDDVRVPGTLGSYARQTMPMGPERSPCALGGKSTKHVGSSKGDERRALHVFIPRRPTHFNDPTTAENSNLMNAPKPTIRTVSHSRPIVETHEDSDVDELSTPDPSQGKPTNPIQFKDLANTMPHTKGSRSSTRSTKVQEAENKIPGPSARRKDESQGYRPVCDMGEDELALMFRW